MSVSMTASAAEPTPHTQKATMPASVSAAVPSTPGTAIRSSSADPPRHRKADFMTHGARPRASPLMPMDSGLCSGLSS